MSCSPLVEVGRSDLGAAAAQNPALVDSADLMPNAAYLGDLSQEVHRGQLPAVAASCKSTLISNGDTCSVDTIMSRHAWPNYCCMLFSLFRRLGRQGGFEPNMGIRAAALAWRGGSVAGDREEPLQQALKVVLTGTPLQHVDDSRSLQTGSTC